ncbi:YveK family protein [Listeria booriae]|uniref:Polysaccharide chain length determinant N-terminal domain-containing protein n=1 Tax=Listeria booriae TaxID=1552123 RepID=A0A7X0Z8X8_9LIST|nr:Wzz/FepE/Etk N-terminal domain-containing protein [Listeria booriae]MBC2178071.1 hypothetical protein [Listeria booriae]MBC2391714.1 hypothetical protein [Listeria booriae]
MNLKTMELGVVLKISKANIWWLIALPIIAVVLAFSISKYYIQPLYTSSAQIFITTNVEAEGGKATVYSDQLKTNMQMANTFNTILKSSRILEAVRDELQLSETNEELAKKINIQSDKDSLVFRVSVEDTNPNRARKIVNKITATYKKDLPQLVDNNKVIILEPANLPLEPTSPSIVLNTLIAFVLGMIANFILVSSIYLFRNHVENESDLAELSLKFVGDIPLIKEGGRNIR